MVRFQHYKSPIPMMIVLDFQILIYENIIFANIKLKSYFPSQTGSVCITLKGNTFVIDLRIVGSQSVKTFFFMNSFDMNL